jgi:alcohol dehydrogenase class IV
MNRPELWTLGQLADADLGRVAVWTTPSVRERVLSRFAWLLADPAAGFPEHVDTLVVVGGGTLIDLAKARRQDSASHARLIAVPSLWGSGAEVSPIAVLTHAEHKEIRRDDALVPDVRVEWPELAKTLPADLATYACGDSWSHAIEGLLSPLATSELREEIADIIGDMLQLPLANDPRWFGVSARACAAQARSSVGLVHGIAHTLEPVLRRQQPGGGWGHARLCTVFLWPVLRLNAAVSASGGIRAAEFGVDLPRVQDVSQELFDSADYDAALPALQEHWMRVLRDPCTRANSVLARKDHLSFFVERAFL